MAGRNVRRVGRRSGRARKEPVPKAHPHGCLRGAVSLPETGGRQGSKPQKWQMFSQRFRKYWTEFVQPKKLLEGCEKVRQEEGACVPARRWRFSLKDSRELMLLAACNVSFSCQEQLLYLYAKNAAIPPTESAPGQVCPSYLIPCIVSYFLLLWIQYLYWNCISFSSCSFLQMLQHHFFPQMCCTPTWPVSLSRVLTPNIN